MAERLIDDFALAVIDENVWAVYNKLAVAKTTVERGFAAAIADSFDFFNAMRNLEQARAAFEAFIFELKVKTQAKSDDWDI